MIRPCFFHWKWKMLLNQISLCITGFDMQMSRGASNENIHSIVFCKKDTSSEYSAFSKKKKKSFFKWHYEWKCPIICNRKIPLVYLQKWAGSIVNSSAHLHMIVWIRFWLFAHAIMLQYVWSTSLVFSPTSLEFMSSERWFEFFLRAMNEQILANKFSND